MRLSVLRPLPDARTGDVHRGVRGLRRWCPPILVLVVALAVAGAGSAHGSTSGPFVKEYALEMGGLPMLGGGPSGSMVRFIEGGRFGIGLYFRNASDQPLTVEDVTTPESPSSPIQQIGTRMAPWNPPPCYNTARGCPVMMTFLNSSYTKVRPAPLVVAPGKAIAAQLNYRIADCGSVLPSPGVPAQTLRISYRDSAGALHAQTLPLGSARIRLRTPMPADCQHRPRSRIAIEGPYATSSDWTIPGDRTGTCLRTAAGRLVCSDGDRCQRTSGGGLLFRSGLFASPGSPMVRIEIRLPRLVGPGLYRTMPVPATALGPAQVRAIVGIGLHGWTTFPSDKSTVTVRQAAGVTLSGRCHATVARHGNSFRTYGIWRCTTLPR